MSGQYAELVERINDEAEWFVGQPPMKLDAEEMRDTFQILREAASALTTLMQQQQRVLYKSCSKHEGMPYTFTATIQPYYKIICPLCDPPKNQMGDTSVPVANGGASTTASGPNNPTAYYFWKDRAEIAEQAIEKMYGSDHRAVEQVCGGCSKSLLPENAWMEDGCPCNSPAGVNNLNLYRWKLLHDLQQKDARRAEAAERLTPKVDGTAQETSTRSADE